MKASHKKRWVSVKVGRAETEVEILPGQFIFGRASASKKLNMNQNTIWKRMQKLKNMRNLTIESNSKYSVISIVNWDTYQGSEKESNSKSNSQVTARQQPGNTNKNVKKVKEDIYTSNFLLFWEAYPRKIGKGKAFENYQKIKQPRPSLKIILDAIEIQNKLDNWSDLRFIPHPATWLNQRRWEDELMPVNKKTLSEKETLEKHGL